jgi:hypothetical protein
MDVIESYFRTLRIFLPRDQRDDIIRELSEEVRSQVAEKESALGRPLNTDEQVAIIGQYGHPLRLAARYRPQRYLIGPIIFPYYWTVLKVVLGIIATVHLVGAAVMIANGAGLSAMGAVLENAIATGLKALGWITVLAAWMDLWLSGSRALERWQPRTPLPVEHARQVTARAASTISALHGRRSPTRWTLGSREPSVTGLVISAVVSVWWLAGLRLPQLFFGPGAIDLEWGPAMDRVYPVLVAAQVMLLIDQLVRLIGSEDARLFQVTRVVWLVAGWVLIYLVATSDHQWMIWHGESAARGAAAVMHVAGRDISLIQFVNYVWTTIFVFVAGMSVWATLKALRRPSRGTPRAAHA